MARNSTKATHYVSQCYLDGFADPASKGKLWSYGYQEGDTAVSVHLVRPAKTAFKNNLYGLDLVARVSLEDLFGAVESLFPATRERLNCFRPISNGDISVLALMFCIHLVRNPSWAKDNQRHAMSVQALIQEVPALDADTQDKLLTHVNAAWGTNYGLQELVGYLASDPALIRKTEKENLFHGLRRLFPLLSERFSKISWRFLIAPSDESFVTCDNPFFWNSPEDAKMVFEHNDDSSIRLDVQFLMTISPSIAAIGMQYESEIDRPSSENISRETCREINNLLIRNRNRYVYSQKNSIDLITQIEAMESRRLR